MIAFMAGCMAGFVLGVVCAALKWAHKTPVEGLPCPHPMCRNRLPRMAAMTDQRGCLKSWVDEDCSVCQGRVRFISGWSLHSDNAGLEHSNDRWVRVHIPEVKP